MVMVSQQRVPHQIVGPWLVDPEAGRERVGHDANPRDGRGVRGLEV